MGHFFNPHISATGPIVIGDGHGRNKTTEPKKEGQFADRFEPESVAKLEGNNQERNCPKWSVFNEK